MLINVLIDIFKGTQYIAELTLMETLLCYRFEQVGLRTSFGIKEKKNRGQAL